MAQFVFINNFNTVLASAITSTQTTITVTSSTGLPTLALDQVIPLTLLDAATKTVYEIVYVTGISGTTLTVERGQEGTTANAYLAGDLVSCNPTVGTVPPIRASLPYTTTQTLPVGNDIIVYTGTLTADVTFTLPSTGMPVAGRIKVYGSASAFTVTVSLANSTGSPFLHLPDGSEVYSYVLPASASQNFIDLFWDGTNWKAFNGGIMSIPNATADNQPVALGQFPFSVGAGANQSTGYIKFPNGIILQWGFINTNGSSSGQTVTYPIAFPNAMFISEVSDQGSGMHTGALSNLSNSQGTVYGGPSAGTYSATDLGWIVVGY
jgi:hypothetical protein